MVGDLAPVALFAYNRPSHLSQVLTALARNPESSRTRLTIFSDGPRTEQDSGLVGRVRTVARNAAETGAFESVTVVDRSVNVGLSCWIIEGVTAVLAESPTVIVLEDDLVVSTSFLGYMNAALREYAEDEDVISVHGFTMNTRMDLPQTFFLRGADCWGWATWVRGWEQFNPDARQLLSQLEESPDQEMFDFNGAFPYRHMLQDQIDGKIDSWAIRWYASAFLANRLTLYPGRSLVRNIGQEGSGTHSLSRSSHEVGESSLDLPLKRIPVEESSEARQAFGEALAGDRTLISRVRRKLRRLRVMR